ncbi:MAG TPA: hypothetical protein VGE05_07670 [Novosphingobium sp.]
MEQALSRIETALARLEAATARPSRGNEELQARHDRLRGSVAASLRQLDALLAGKAP